MKITVVDAIMGSGKTSAAINKMKEDEDSNYIFITPYLKEVDRIKDTCKEREFVEPENKGEGKLEDLHRQIIKGCNIASTHALFKTYNDETKTLLQEKKYKLILDEVFGVLEIVKLHKDDLNLMLRDKLAYIDENNFVVWLADDYHGNKFKEIKGMARNKNLMLIEDMLLLWNFPVDIFNSFKEVNVLTYMFDAQIQKYYYDLYDVDIIYSGVKNKSGYYYFSDENDIPEYVKTLKDKIIILEDEKLNSIGNTRTDLSKSWFERECRKRKREKKNSLIKELKNNLINIYSNRWPNASSEENMWTTFKDFKPFLSGKGYTRGFVSVNARATNDYRHKKYLAYCANIYFNPNLKNYFIERGVNVQEDKYALSELIQWIWRSAIREEKPINIYLPSKRMRELLKGWLNLL